MQYREDFFAANPTKKNYVEGLNRLLERRNADAAAHRAQYTKDIFTDGERYRADFRAMLGWPLVGHTSEGIPNATSALLADEDTHRIYRMSFEILDGVELTGLYFEYKEEGEHPLVLVQHGALGSPELISNFYGNTSNYHDMLERVIRHGVHAFAPQLLLWEAKYDVPFQRQEIDAALKRVGSSITAIEVYGLTRILDYFEAREQVSTFGMVGMSYGGFYTLCTSALDTRIQSAVSCAFFNTLDRVLWSDWTWQNSAEKFNDAEIAALSYPRHLCIEIANNDPLLTCRYGIESYERLKAMSDDVGTDWLDFRVFDGVHEFSRDDAPIENLVAHLKSKK